MNVIYKYPLPFSCACGFDMFLPVGAKILSVQLQEDVPVLWAMVDTSRQTELRKFVVLDTGQWFADYLTTSDLSFLGTIQTGGVMVWHIFELKSDV